jgi:hypothetical protein
MRLAEGLLIACIVIGIVVNIAIILDAIFGLCVVAFITTQRALQGICFIRKGTRFLFLFILRCGIM